MAKVVHFEIPVDDADRATAFYQEVLGWQVNGWGDQPYWLVTAGPEDEPGADGALIPRGDVHTSPVLIVSVEDIGATLKTAERAGGAVLQDKLPIPDMGWSAYLRDSEGNTIGLFQQDPGAGG